MFHQNSNLVYADEDLGINSFLAGDSIFSDQKQSLFAGIKEVQVKGVDYKMFFYPFKIGNEDVQLAGFIKNEVYYKKLHHVPVSFVYPVIIILLLLLIMMPLTKYFMMGKDEQITFTDFILAITSCFSGAAIITIIIIQVLLLMAADIRIQQNLCNISGQIENNFKQEITCAYRQLGKIDTIISNDPKVEIFLAAKYPNTYDGSYIIRDYYKDHQPVPGEYYNFNRIAWIDRDGNQQLKAQVDEGAASFTNVSLREYFKVFSHSPGYPVPGLPGRRFGFEPVNSLTNGDFNVIISEKTNLGEGWVSTISAPMYSVIKTILPPGYGFCLIDENGKVLLHSESNRNLQENIIDNLDPSRPISEAIKSRQEFFYANINLYSNNHSVHINPVKDLPFYLVTFYDKGYIVPVNMRILSFCLLFCTITFGACLIMWLGLRKSIKKFTSSLYGPLYKLKWLLPKQTNLEFYVLGKQFLLVNLALQVITIFSFKQFGISNYAVLVLTIMMPVNLYTGLSVINYRVRKDMPVTDKRHILTSKKRVAIYIIIQLLAGLAVWLLSSSEEYPIHKGFLYFTLFFNIFLWIVYSLPAGTFGFVQRSKMNYLRQYAIYSTLLILSLTVWPASLYTWYAHNQEITQSLKKEQLYLADALKKRASDNQSIYKQISQLKPPSWYVDSMQRNFGIYNIYSDSIFLNNDNNYAGDTNSSYERFYFSIADKIGNNYYDPLLIPALKGESADTSWHWQAFVDTADKKEKLFFTYHLYDEVLNKTVADSNSTLRIISTFPPRYIFVNASKASLLLLLLVAAIIYGLYRLLIYTSYRLFLVKFITGNAEDETADTEKLLLLFKEYKQYCDSTGKPAGITETDIKNLKKEYIYYKTTADEYEMEKALLAALNKFNNFFDFTWNKLSAKEKFLLLNYAENGFVNFKNTAVINRLIELGIFKIQNEELRIFSLSFRKYVLEQKTTDEMISLKSELRQQSAWQSFRIPLLFIILGVAFFIFTTQEQTFEKVTALLTAVTTVFTLLVRFFTDGSSLFGAKKQ